KLRILYLHGARFYIYHLFKAFAPSLGRSNCSHSTNRGNKRRKERKSERERERKRERKTLNPKSLHSGTQQKPNITVRSSF
ncbi:mCG1032811, partial [Mus musculus]